MKYILMTLVLLLSFKVHSEDKIKLKTTTIKGNTELPKILYVVPWQDVAENTQSHQKLMLHSLFGDLFDPVTPKEPKSESK